MAIFNSYVKLPKGKLFSGWWLEPSWKILVNGTVYPIYEMENKIHVWNHQPPYMEVS